MKKVLLSFIVSFILLSCVGTSPNNLRQAEAQEYTSTHHKDDLKLCLLNKLDEFKPDRISVNDFSDRTEVFLGAIQAGKLRNYYLFTVKDKQIKLSKYDGYYRPLSLSEAQKHIQDCI